MALAALKEKLENWEEAVNAFHSEDYEGALSIFQSMEPSSQIAMNIGFICTIQGDEENALKQYTTAITRDSYLALAYFERGVSYYKTGKLGEAEADFCTAEVMMKGKPSWLYSAAGLEFTLFSAEILFNKALVLVKSGREQEAMTILRRADGLQTTLEHHAIKDAIENIKGDYTMFSVTTKHPVAIYHPAPEKMKFLKNYRLSQPLSSAGTPSILPSASSPDLGKVSFTSDHDHDDDSDTCAGSSESLPLEKTKQFLTAPRSSMGSMSTVLASSSSTPSPPTRSELARVVGIDMITPTTEISTIPCAGIRICHGRLVGLMAWRLVVSLYDQKEGTTRRQQMKQRHWKDVPLGKSVITNFILDTGCAMSPIPQETLRALGYRGSYRAGTEVMLRIQGVPTKCVIAEMGEAGRLGSQFMTSGSLTFYFAQKIDAPVLYVADESGNGPSDIPRTVEPDRKSRRISIRDGVTALMNSFSLRLSSN
ncbi:hypothetical protein AAF712_001741 [Marasmius tenuissimus]|uniref:Uncharacterized protein n=1 Tax=Marasmius tenuissimus TaxID=585030 RepID=A0ABR3ACX0_9AGAR